MGRNIGCPRCGAPNELVNPGITMFDCSSCDALVYWTPEHGVASGERSILPENDSRLYLGARGAVVGRRFSVVGHVRYDHGQGAWDEWHLSLDDGSEGWFSEDERRLLRQQRLGDDAALPPRSALRLGEDADVDGETFVVRELGEATCVGSEGQLPFAHLLGEVYAYVDLVSGDGKRYASLEYDEGERPSAFLGVVVPHDDLVLDAPKPSFGEHAKEGESINCTSCTAPLDLPSGRKVATQVCSYCGALLDLSDAERRVLGKNPTDFDHRFAFEIGERGRFDDKAYEVCGRMYYADPEGYITREYLLFEPRSGYLWLAEDGGHYVLHRQTTAVPRPEPRGLAQKAWLKANGRNYQVYERGHVTLQYVDGALPWIARVGDSGEYCDAIAPPYVFSAEYAAGEVEYFEGEYIPPKDVWAAFEKSGSPPKPWAAHGAKPIARSRAASVLSALGLVAFVVNVMLLFNSCSHPGEKVFEQSFAASEYSKETVSAPFTLGDDRVVGLEMDAQVNNSWVSLQMALIDAQDNVVSEVDADLAYYQGVEGGESWSEGSTSTTEYFISPPPGEYRLILLGTGGRGEAGPPGNESVTIRVLSGSILSRYYFFAALLALLFPLIIFMRRSGLDRALWEAVLDD